MSIWRWQTTWAANKIVHVISIFIVLASLVAGVAGHGGIVHVAAAGFAAGDTVVVNTDYLNLRDGPSLKAYHLAILIGGDELTVTGGSEVADGYTWYPVVASVKGPMPGWVAGEYLELVSGDGTGGFQVGDAAVVDTAKLNCRTGPGLNYPVDHVMSGGADVVVLDGPVTADGYHWYQLKMENDDTAWAIGEALAPVSDVPNAEFGKGDQVVVDTDYLNLRTGAGLSYTVIAVLKSGTALTVANHPIAAGGYVWYGVTTRDGRTGWVAGTYLAPAPGLGFAVGDAVRVANGPQNLRAGSGTEAAVIRVMANGTLLQVRGGPVEANGYTWYHVWNYSGEGWAAGEFLQLDPNGWPEEGAA